MWSKKNEYGYGTYVVKIIGMQGANLAIKVQYIHAAYSMYLFNEGDKELNLKSI